MIHKSHKKHKKLNLCKQGLWKEYIPEALLLFLLLTIQTIYCHVPYHVQTQLLNLRLFLILSPFQYMSRRHS